MPGRCAVLWLKQSGAAPWRKLCCQAMLAGLLAGALGLDLLERFPSTRSELGAAVESGAHTGRVQRLNLDAATWAPPIAVFSGRVLLTGEPGERAEDTVDPSARPPMVNPDRAPPARPRSASALRHS